MNIAFERPGCIQWRFMSLRLEILAGQTLILNKGCVEIEVLNDFVINFMHLIIEGLRFGSCVSQTPGAGEIIEIPAALLGWENIEDNGLAKRHQILGVANRMWHSCIPTDGKNSTLCLRRTAFCKPQ